MAGGGGEEEAVRLRVQVVLEEGRDARTFELVPRWEPRPPKPPRAAVTGWDSYAALPEGEVIPPVRNLGLTIVRGGDIIAFVDLVPCESEQEAEVQNREDNCYFKVGIDPSDDLVTVRFYEIEFDQGIQWRSTGVYYIECVDNGDYGYSSVDQIFKSMVHFHGTDSLVIAFPPLRMNFKKDFTNEGRIGSGVEGTVYRCLSKFNAHYCAVKETCPQNFFEPYTGSEPSDAMILSMLNHANIVELFLAWSEQKGGSIFGTGSIFVSMKLYPRSLRNHLNKSGGFNLVTRKSIFKQLMTGIEFMDRHHVVHRDIKPENVLLAEDLTVKIADFGVAKIKEPPHYLGFSGGGCYGSKPYSAPEVENIYKQHDEKADIFSAGMLFYELFVPDVRGRKEKVEKLSKSITEKIQDFDQSRLEFDLGIVLDGTNVLTDWRGHLPLLEKMTWPKAEERPSALEILSARQLNESEAEREEFVFLLG